jgi:ABC-type uncharacterized transport system permease subunit
MHDVTAGQLALLFAAVALFAAAEAASLARVWWDREKLRVAAKACLYLGTLCGLGVVVWHAVHRGSWLPLEDNFDALVWLGLLLALFVLYTQRAHPLRGLDWFLVPVIAMLLVSAAVFGKAKPHEYGVGNVWAWVHRVTAYGGAVAFAVAGAVGCMYLIVNRRLRAKPPTPGPNFGSLERLEHLTLVSVTLGFSLLTIGAVTGMTRWFEGGHKPPLYKVVLTAIVWLVYALVLHSPMNPSFRGRKTAVLSVLGFVLMVGTLVAVQFMPSRG